MRLAHLTKAIEEVATYGEKLEGRSPRCAMNPDDSRMTVASARKRFAAAGELLREAEMILLGVDEPAPRPKAKAKKSKK